MPQILCNNHTHAHACRFACVCIYLCESTYFLSTTIEASRLFVVYHVFLALIRMD